MPAPGVPAHPKKPRDAADVAAKHARCGRFLHVRFLFTYNGCVVADVLQDAVDCSGTPVRPDFQKPLRQPLRERLLVCNSERVPAGALFSDVYLVPVEVESSPAGYGRAVLSLFDSPWVGPPKESDLLRLVTVRENTAKLRVNLAAEPVKVGEVKDAAGLVKLCVLVAQLHRTPSTLPAVTPATVVGDAHKKWLRRVGAFVAPDQKAVKAGVAELGLEPFAARFLTAAVAFDSVLRVAYDPRFTELLSSYTKRDLASCAKLGGFLANASTKPPNPVVVGPPRSRNAPALYADTDLPFAIYPRRSEMRTAVLFKLPIPPTESNPSSSSYDGRKTGGSEYENRKFDQVGAPVGGDPSIDHGGGVGAGTGCGVCVRGGEGERGSFGR